MAMAPAEGLFLAEVLFTNYTQRCDFKSNMPISLEGVATQRASQPASQSDCQLRLLDFEQRS